jgi:hypothetical protein
MQRVILALLLLSVAPCLSAVEAQEPKPDADGWYSLFDGKSLAGWKAAEHPQGFKVADGLIAAGETPLAHLYYFGPVRNAKFKDFELKAEVKTRPKGNSGIIFHTAFQDKGFPDRGFEFQINNTGSDKAFRTGGIYPAKPFDRVVAKDDEWFECHLIVRANQVTLKVNGETTMETTLPHEAKSERTLGTGTLAIQSHDTGSMVYFRSIRVKPLE